MLDKLLNRCKELFYIKDSILYNRISRSPNCIKDNKSGYLDSMYLRVCIDKKRYLVHRIMFLMYNGYLPDVVDHINGDTLDNSKENLRESSKLENRWNSKGNAGTQTGVKGVYLDRGRFKALINVNGTRYYLGMFDSVENAKKAVDSKYLELQKEHSLQASRDSK